MKNGRLTDDALRSEHRTADGTKVSARVVGGADGVRRIPPTMLTIPTGTVTVSITQQPTIAQRS
jgi:hypothetical protein